MVLIAILRGLAGREAVDVGRCLYDEGFRAMEVPLNSPDPLLAIAALRSALPADCAVGAGTVLTPAQVRECADAGAEMIISPNTDPGVIRESVGLGLQVFPGAATPTEAFVGLAEGATGIKVFPAEQVGVAGMKAWTAVLPDGTALLPVGGVDASTMAAWLAAGATGFGVGSSLYRPGVAIDELRARAAEIVSAWTAGTTRSGGVR